jgi:DNA-binding protein Fis
MYEEFLSIVEPPLLQAMMDASNHNRALVAAQLGMHRSTLRQKMRRYEIE